MLIIIFKLIIVICLDCGFLQHFFNINEQDKAYIITIVIFNFYYPLLMQLNFKVIIF